MRTTRRQLARILSGMTDSPRIFSVRFVKRTNGEVRRMVCRFGVTSYLRGGGRAYEFEDYNLLCVFDIQKKEYRCINLEGLLEAKIEGVKYSVR